ncbi:A disintegrin and metalloproteinase with thrombospondin motifs 20-like [Ruditapes philippinarum]|uniref:A disintegrin and metalloproteinase with thrombospondin motifs 20-like n=1 Tax=Ruditapes philippinarum TaxID=129788 RepID=UPI00295B3103|nr:A disintegrin and metalloproteinase with thrombospondin motifs 20-like [Ruditapes philippinarum]
MSTATPSEYVTIDENNNFGYDAGGYNATDVGTLTKYKKIRIIIETMTIERKDPTFNEPPTSKMHYAKGKSCNCVRGACPPWLGYFQISTVGTGMKFSEKASWIANGHNPGIANFSRNGDSTVISANCGGRCGGCKPNWSLNLLYNEKDVVEDSKAIHPYCV